MSDTLYYKESYISHTPYYHTEASGGRNGEAGIPVSTTLPTDSLVLTVFFIFGIIIIGAFRRSWRYTRFMLRNYWNTARGDAYDLRESLKEARHHWPLPFITTVLLATVVYLGMSHYLQWETRALYEYDQQCLDIMGTKLYIPNLIRYATITGIFLLYIVLKVSVQHIANLFLFNNDSRRLWSIIIKFHFVMLGVLILPALIVQYLFHLQPIYLLAYTVIIFILTKINGFIRTYTIFFSKKSNYFKYFLYLCALEIMPMAILAGILIATHSGNQRW